MIGEIVIIAALQSIRRENVQILRLGSALFTRQCYLAGIRR
jgi:hypothetical protein